MHLYCNITAISLCFLFHEVAIGDATVKGKSYHNPHLVWVQKISRLSANWSKLHDCPPNAQVQKQPIYC